jgi:hypothetical protein
VRRPGTVDLDRNVLVAVLCRFKKHGAALQRKRPCMEVWKTDTHQVLVLRRIGCPTGTLCDLATCMRDRTTSLAATLLHSQRCTGKHRNMDLMQKNSKG